MTCPNCPTHNTRREPSNRADGPGWQIYCAVCAEFFEPCTIRLGPMEFCKLTAGHGNVHEDKSGNAYVLNLAGVSRLCITREDANDLRKWDDS